MPSGVAAGRSAAVERGREKLPTGRFRLLTIRPAAKTRPDATPAACYAHANHRRKVAEIVAQIAKPRFGDGVDLVIGGGRKGILAATKEAGYDLDAEQDYTETEEL